MRVQEFGEHLEGKNYVSFVGAFDDGVTEKVLGNVSLLFPRPENFDFF